MPKPPARMRRWVWTIGGVALLSLSFGAGWWLPSRIGHAVDETPGDLTSAGAAGVSGGSDRPAIPPQLTSPDVARRPLPPLDAPLHLIAAELAARAGAGDARAACRLAAEYEWCDALRSRRAVAAARVARLPASGVAGSPDKDALTRERQAAGAALAAVDAQFAGHCADAPPLGAARRAGYWRQAALQGHPSALRHYAIGNAFRFHDILDALPELERYRREAGALALRAANAGDAAMIYALAMAHAEGSDSQHRPFLAQTLPPDAARALVWFRRLDTIPAVQRLPETHPLRREIDGYLASLPPLVSPDELLRAEAALAGYRPPTDEGAADPLPRIYRNGGLGDVDRVACAQDMPTTGRG